MHKIKLTKDASKYYLKCDKSIKEVINKAFTELQSNPFRGNNIKKLHGKLSGLFRLRVNNIRIIYKIEKSELIVVIIAIGPRGDIYK